MIRAPSVLLFGACAVAMPLAAEADDAIVLKFGYANPPNTWINTVGVAGWVKDVEARTSGRVKVQVFAGGAVVNQRNIYDRLLNGVVDAAYGPFGAISDQMPRVEVTTLPFESETIASASAAAWRLYKAGLFDEDFQRVRIITTFCLPHAGLHTSKEVKRLEDLKGVKLTTASRANGEIIERLGATPVTVSNPEAYGALQRGLAAGTILPDAAVMTFNLQEVTKYHISLGLGCTTGGFFMNKDSYARLPSDARAAIDATSGEVLAKFMAAESDRQNHIAHEKIAAMPGAVYHTLDPKELRRWYERLRPMADAWVQKTPDGAKVLAAFRAEIARIKKGS